MLLVYTLLAVLVVAAALYIVSLCFGLKKNPVIKVVRRLSLLVVIILAISCSTLSAAYKTNALNLHEAYNDLILYYNVINETEDEYVRFDYYGRVLEFNERLDNTLSQAENAWFGGLYPKNWDEDLGFIDFPLRTGG